MQDFSRGGECMRPQAPDDRRVNLTAVRSRAFYETANLPDTERVAVMKERLTDPFRQFDRPRPATPESQQRFDGRIAAWLNQFPALRPNRRRQSSSPQSTSGHAALAKAPRRSSPRQRAAPVR
jgi:hypothetical protein